MILTKTILSKLAGIPKISVLNRGNRSCSVSKETVDLTVTRLTLWFKSANISLYFVETKCPFGSCLVKCFLTYRTALEETMLKFKEKNLDNSRTVLIETVLVKESLYHQI